MADVGGIAAERLKSFVERIERLEEEKAALAADVREVFAEAKATGFDTKIMRQVIKLRKMEQNDRQEQEHLLSAPWGWRSRAASYSAAVAVAASGVSAGGAARKAFSTCSL
jgi:uncharacterized protein (UPF0335 family)